MPGLLPAEPAAPPLEPLVDPLAAPVVLPAGAPGLAAVFNRAWPVALSLQCVAAEMFALAPAEGDGLEGDGLDCAAAPTMLAPRNAAEIRRVLYMRSLPRHSPLAITVQTSRHFTMINLFCRRRNGSRPLRFAALKSARGTTR
jgi:hypothetical protein